MGKSATNSDLITWPRLKDKRVYISILFLHCLADSICSSALTNTGGCSQGCSSPSSTKGSVSWRVCRAEFLAAFLCVPRRSSNHKPIHTPTRTATAAAPTCVKLRGGGSAGRPQGNGESPWSAGRNSKPGPGGGGHQRAHSAVTCSRLPGQRRLRQGSAAARLQLAPVRGCLGRHPAVLCWGRPSWHNARSSKHQALA